MLCVFSSSFSRVQAVLRQPDGHTRAEHTTQFHLITVYLLFLAEGRFDQHLSGFLIPSSRNLRNSTIFLGLFSGASLRNVSDGIKY